MNDESLLASLVQNPEPGALRVYADHLLEEGDPLGEFISLQLGRAPRSLPTQREEVLRDEVLEPPLRSLLEPSSSGLTCHWEQGFLHSVEFDVGDGPLDALQKLEARREAKLLRRVVMRALSWTDGPDSLDALWVSLVKQPRFRHLKELSVERGLDLGNPYIVGPLPIGALEPLYEAYPKLEVLGLSGVGHEFGRIVLPELKRFSAAVLTLGAIDSLVNAYWPRLEELELEFGPAGGEAEPIFGPLLNARMSESLKRVRVTSPWPDFFRAALPRSPLGRGRVVEV
ncbi:MAG TPA: hypothetical protein VGE37_12335 [Archangium sp.]